MDRKGTGIKVDIMYWDKNWIAEQIENVLEKQQAGVGLPSTVCCYSLLLFSDKKSFTTK